MEIPAFDMEEKAADWLQLHSADFFEELDAAFYDMFNFNTQFLSRSLSVQRSFLRCVRMTVLHLIRIRLSLSPSAKVDHLISSRQKKNGPIPAHTVFYKLAKISAMMATEPALTHLLKLTNAMAVESHAFVDMNVLGGDSSAMLTPLASCLATLQNMSEAWSDVQTAWGRLDEMARTGETEEEEEGQEQEQEEGDVDMTGDDDEEEEEDKEEEGDEAPAVRVRGLLPSDSLPNCYWLTVGDFNRCRAYVAKAMAEGRDRVSRMDLMGHGAFKTSSKIKIAPSAAIQALTEEGLLIGDNGNKFGYLINAKAVGGEAADQTEFRPEFPKLSAGLQKEQDKFIARTA